jgi:hypothetical protein
MLPLDSSSYMLLELNLDYLLFIIMWNNGVSLLFMMYLKSPLIKFGIIEMFVDVKKMFMFYIFEINKFFFFSNFEYAQSIFFLKWELFS